MVDGGVLCLLLTVNLAFPFSFCLRIFKKGATKIMVSGWAGSGLLRFWIGVQVGTSSLFFKGIYDCFDFGFGCGYEAKTAFAFRNGG